MPSSAEAVLSLALSIMLGIPLFFASPYFFASPHSNKNGSICFEGKKGGGSQGGANIDRRVGSRGGTKTKGQNLGHL
jgi:hypothetical protein